MLSLDGGLHDMVLNKAHSVPHYMNTDEEALNKCLKKIEGELT
jgi:hypothetical protein